MTKLIESVQKNDFRKIFDLTYAYQNHISRIKSNNPKVVWDKMVSEFYENKKGGYLMEENFKELIALLIPPNKWKIIETRGNKVYVSIKYNNVEESPLLDESAYWNKTDRKLLKEAILDFTLSANGLYMSCKRVPAGNVYWENYFKILSVIWEGEPGGFCLWVVLLGGTPPYSSLTVCGNCYIEKSKKLNLVDSDTLKTCFFYDEYKSFRKCLEEHQISSPHQFSIVVFDSSRRKDSAEFIVPDLSKKYCWIANPWSKWGQFQHSYCKNPIVLQHPNTVSGEGQRGKSNKESPLEILNIETKWMDKYYQPLPPKLIIVPSITFRIKNISNQSLESINFKANFWFKDTSENLGDVFFATSRGSSIQPGEISEVITLKSSYGVEDMDLESFKDNPKLEAVIVRLFAQSKDFPIFSLGEWAVSKKIDFKEPR